MNSTADGHGAWRVVFPRLCDGSVAIVIDCEVMTKIHFL